MSHHHCVSIVALVVVLGTIQFHGYANAQIFTCGNGFFDSTIQGCRCDRNNFLGFWAINPVDGRCTICATGYHGPSCTWTCPNDCSGNGTCIAQDTCECFENRTDGFWTRSDCSRCLFPYGGLQCTDTCPSVSAQECSGNGTCIVLDATPSAILPTCSCIASQTRGFYAGSDCSQCASGFDPSTGCRSEITVSNASSTSSFKPGYYVLVIGGALAVLIIVVIVVIFVLKCRKSRSRRENHIREPNSISGAPTTTAQQEHHIDSNPSNVSSHMNETIVVTPISPLRGAMNFSSRLDKLLEPSREVREVIEEQGDSIPKDLICPITGELFVDPVLTSDGHTFERIAIAEWLSKKATSPITNLPIDKKTIIPNHTVRSQCIQLREKYMGIR